MTRGSPSTFLRQHVVVFVRYGCVEANSRGLKVGISALTNGLLSDGVLTPAEVERVRENNYWYENTYIDPAKVEPGVFDRLINPGTECWFQSDAHHLIIRIEGYLQFVDQHGVSWEKVESEKPSRIVYEDDVQIVVSVPISTYNVTQLS